MSNENNAVTKAEQLDKELKEYLIKMNPIKYENFNSPVVDFLIFRLAILENIVTELSKPKYNPNMKLKGRKPNEIL